MRAYSPTKLHLQFNSDSELKLAGLERNRSYGAAVDVFVASTVTLMLAQLTPTLRSLAGTENLYFPAWAVRTSGDKLQITVFANGVTLSFPASFEGEIEDC
ncbi:MAG: hypothetical protein QW838_02985 [Candidatus Nitrosotenuis sp.]